MTQVFEVYDKDVINDHRMAIDLYDHSKPIFPPRPLADRQRL